MATLEEKRRYLERWFRGWTARGYGSGQAYEEYMRVREYIPRQYRIRKTDFLRLYREYAGIEMRHRQLRSVPRNRVPSERLYSERPLFSGRRYHSVVRVRGIDLQTGEEVEQFFTLAHDNLMRRSEIEERTLNWVKVSEGRYSKRWETADLWEGFRNTNVP